MVDPQSQYVSLIAAGGRARRPRRDYHAVALGRLLLKFRDESEPNFFCSGPVPHESVLGFLLVPSTWVPILEKIS